MRGKFLSLFLTVLGLLMIAVLFRVDQYFFDDKMSSHEASARLIVGTVSETVQSELKHVKENFDASWPQARAEKKISATGPSSRFHMMGQLQRESTGSWSFREIRFHESGEVKAWAENYSLLALKQFDEQKISVGGSFLLSILDPARKVYFLVVSRGTDGVSAVLLNADLFQATMDRQKSSDRSVFVVNPLGQTIAHTTAEYVGTLLTEDPLVSHILKSDQTAGSGNFKSAQVSIWGFYESIPGTNLSVAMTSPLSEVTGGRRSLQTQLILLGLGFALIGAAIFLSMGKSSDTEARVPLAPVAPVTVAKEPVDAHAIYSRTASGLANELKIPLLNVLGQAKLLRQNITDEKLLLELKKIEDGARAAHGTIHKMLVSAGDQKVEISATSVEEVCKRCLRAYDEELKRKNIQIDTQFSSVALVKGQTQQLGQVIDQVLKNSIEAMNRTSSKKLSLILTQAEDRVHLKIEDTGIGLSRESKQHAFEPFYTTKPKLEHSGLGLSLALGLLKPWGGGIQIDSTLGKGAVVDISFTPWSEHEEVTALTTEEESRNLLEASRLIDLQTSPPGMPPAPLTAEKSQPVTPEMPAVLNDSLMKRTMDMIDYLDEVPEPFAGKSPAPPVPPQAPPSLPLTELVAEVAASTLLEDVPAPSLRANSQLDKPHFAPPENSRQSKLMSLQTKVRKPGDLAT